jgi:serine phosphatase RsbU (regulator of sigma subunit)
MYLNSDNQFIPDIFPDKEKYRKAFVDPLAENLFHSFEKSGPLPVVPESFNKGFRKLTKTERSFWYNYAGAIPDKFKALNLFIRPYADFCRTCIITDDEISLLGGLDNEKYASDKFIQKIVKSHNNFFRELDYLIPASLKIAGYEVIRYEEVFEINNIMIRRLARAIHSRYQREIRIRNIKDKDPDSYNTGKLYTSDFDDLPDEIRYSNIDNAAHIPTKLLSIGYKIRPVKKGFKSFALHLNDIEIETMATVEHLRWSWEKRLNGWRQGSTRNDATKTHPSLVPYQELSESEKEKDRELVRLIPAFLQDIDYEAYPVSPNRIKKLAYAIKPQSSIHKILDDTRELNDQIRNLVTLTPLVEEMVTMRNKKIEDAISEVEESYNYAQHIQETFLPDDLYVRECFTDSFVLFKPKDIVSGDFYFFSKQENLIIFAAADCTGHGIPGAMLSTLGYGILDQAINEVKLTDPSLILFHLYSKIHRYLRNDLEGPGISDDMDIALCVLDTRTNALKYSGVKNPLYRITKGELIVYPSQNQSDEGCEAGICRFTSTNIQLKISDTIYICSDGYTDQFGGRHHKKYQRRRFMDFILSLGECSMTEQSDRLYEEIEHWREEKNEDQTDDILVIGIRI